NNLNNIVLSISKIIPNNKEEKKNFSLKNSANWNVITNKLILPYTKAIIGQLFINDCIDIENKKEIKKILILGLGGGSISNYLAEIKGNNEIISIEIDPAIEYIARKWFGLKNKQNHKIIIQDAIEFIKNWENKDGQFKCIIIDVCSNLINNNTLYPLICPINELVHNEIIITKMFEMLKETGTLLINTFVFETKFNKIRVAKERKFLLELFSYYFGYCYYVDILYNKILICTLNSILNGKIMTNKLYKEKVEKIPDWVQNEIKENNFQINILNDIYIN
ncbi:hypothetical protein Mgra_00000496, partial [Meloidogyne graminicola]